jgi:hypothetical protein
MPTSNASKTIVEPEFVPDADVTVAPETWEWDTVSEAAATRVVFDTIGDTFVGKLLRKDYIEREPAADGKDQSFHLWVFKGRDGDTYAINNSYEIDEALANIPFETWVRIQYLKDVKTARNLNPMKSFKVDVKK